MLISFLQLICGGLGLYFGSSYLIRGVSSFSLRVGISPFVVGVVIVGFGTSTPELVVSLLAALDGKGDITLGNVIGSNCANIGLALGSAALWKPIAIPWKKIQKDLYVLLGITALFICFLVLNFFTRLIGALFALLLTVYLLQLIRNGKSEKVEVLHSSLTTDILQMSGGLLFLLVGAELFYQGALTLATLFGVSDAIIGLTVVAIGTSLPELATVLMAAMKNEGEIALGNVVGSCIYNILGIVGFTALVQPYQTADIQPRDSIVLALFTIIVTLMLFSGKRLERWEGGLLFVGYIGYLLLLIY